MDTDAKGPQRAELDDPRTLTTIRNLARRWANADRQALRQFFGPLALGRPASVVALSAASGLDSARIDRALDSGPIGRDEQGRLVELYGYKLSPGWHRVEYAGRFLWACCALVAHAVPRLLGGTVEIESIDPVTHERIGVTVGPSGLQAVAPAGAVATFALSDGPWAPGDDLADAFCSHMRHFATAAGADEFAAADRRRRIVDMPTFDRLVDQTTRRVWDV